MKRLRILVLRRLVQFGIIGLFLSGSWWGVEWLKGNLSASEVLETVTLVDPFLALQSLVSGQVLGMVSLLGVLIVVLFYLVVGGRSYCSWVCPLNIVTDFAAWFRSYFKIKNNISVSKNTRYWLLFGVLALSATSGSMVWELVNPVSGFQRGILSGLSSAWAIGVGIFLLDVFIGKNLWCGHLCPTGAFYAQINTVGLLRVKAPKQAECDDCGDCYRVCPEPQILPPVLKGDHPLKVVGDSVCTNCGRCIEVCDRAVFQYGVRPFGKS